ALKPLPRRIILRARRKQALRPLCDLFRRQRLTVRNHPSEQFLIFSASQHPLLERLRINLQKIDQSLIEPHRDVVVVLNLASMSQSNLVNKPPKVSNAAKESFGTSGIFLIAHASCPPQKSRFRS